MNEAVIDGIILMFGLLGSLATFLSIVILVKGVKDKYLHP